VRGVGSLSVSRPATPEDFEARARDLLAPREAENNLIFGLISALRAGRRYGPDRPFFAVVHDANAILGAAMRTPPFNLIIAAGTEERAVPLILDALARETEDLTGITGPNDLARSAAETWSARTGRRARQHMALRIYRLTRVRPPRGVRGQMRPAGPADLDLVADWLLAFARESGAQVPASATEHRAQMERWIASDGVRLWVDGQVVSVAGAQGPTPNGIRIGGVYTPPELRRRGYASALVAALSQEQLDRGRTFCFLFTDLANPTSNKIYMEIGYEPVSDVADHRFESAS
jgi:predicted GNAT family acetyltransferase